MSVKLQKESLTLYYSSNIKGTLLLNVQVATFKKFLIHNVEKTLPERSPLAVKCWMTDNQFQRNFYHIKSFLCNKWGIPDSRLHFPLISPLNGRRPTCLSLPRKTLIGSRASRASAARGDVIWVWELAPFTQNALLWADNAPAEVHVSVAALHYHSLQQIRSSMWTLRKFYERQHEWTPSLSLMWMWCNISSVHWRSWTSSRPGDLQQRHYMPYIY